MTPITLLLRHYTSFRPHSCIVLPPLTPTLTSFHPHYPHSLASFYPLLPLLLRSTPITPHYPLLLHRFTPPTLFYSHYRYSYIDLPLITPQNDVRVLRVIS